MTVACLTIYATYMVVVSCMPYDFTNTEVTVSWTSSWEVELMASNKDKLRRRRERDGLRRQKEAAREREAPTKLAIEGARSNIVTLLPSISAQHAPASGTCAMHEYPKCCSLQLRMFPVILFSWSLLAKRLYTCGYTVYGKTFKGENFHGFLANCESFPLESLAVFST